MFHPREFIQDFFLASSPMIKFEIREPAIDLIPILGVCVCKHRRYYYFFPQNFWSNKAGQGRAFVSNSHQQQICSLQFDRRKETPSNDDL